MLHPWAISVGLRTIKSVLAPLQRWRPPAPVGASTNDQSRRLRSLGWLATVPSARTIGIPIERTTTQSRRSLGGMSDRALPARCAARTRGTRSELTLLGLAHECPQNRLRLLPFILETYERVQQVDIRKPHVLCDSLAGALILILTWHSIRSLHGCSLRLLSALEPQKFIRHIVILQQDWRARGHRFVEMCDLCVVRNRRQSTSRSDQFHTRMHEGGFCGAPSRRPRPATSADTFRPCRPPSV